MLQVGLAVLSPSKISSFQYLLSIGTCQILGFRISYALIVYHLAARFERLRLRRILRVGVAERQNGENRPSVLDPEHRADFCAVEITDPAGAEAERPSSVRHVLDGLPAIDVGPSRVGDVLEHDDRRRRIGYEAAGRA